jgi:hypothetical protein
MRAGRGAAAAVLAGVVSAAGQEAGPRGRYKLGPLHLTPRLELRNAGIDSNVFNTRVDPIPDTSVVLRPSVEGGLGVGRRLRATGKGWVDVNYFRQRRTERSFDFGGEGSAELDVGRITLLGGGGGRQSKQRFAQDFDERLLQQEKWADAGLRLRITRKTALTVKGAGRVFLHESFLVQGAGDVRDALDRNTLSVVTQLRYALTRRTTALVSAEAIEDRFLHAPPDLARHVRSFRYLAGFEFGPRAAVQGQILAGLREFPARFSPGAPAYRGPALDVEAALPLRSVRLAGIARRDVYYSVSGARQRDDRLRNTYVSALYRGELATDLPFQLLGQGYVEFLSARSILPRQQGDHLVHRVDHTWTVGGSLLRRFGDGIKLGGTVAWSRRRSAFGGFDYLRFLYGLQGEVLP